MVDTPSSAVRTAVYENARLRAAQTASRLIALTIGGAAALCAFVAILFALNFAFSLAASWGEAVKLGAVALGVVLGLTGLPVASALLVQRHAKDEQVAMGLWVSALIVTGVCTLAFVIRMPGVSAAHPATGRTASGMHSEIARLEHRVSDDIWYYSNGCQAPQDRYQRRECADVNAARRQSAWASAPDLSPSAILPATATSDNFARRLFVAMFGLAALAGAGWLGRLSILAQSEAWRLETGEIGQETNAPALPEPAVDVTAALTPADVFSMWANARLTPTPGGKVTGADAYADYVETCRMNGIEPMASGKFGSLLTARATASEGAVIKSKIGGINTYTGWELPKTLQDGHAEVRNGHTPAATFTGAHVP